MYLLLLVHVQVFATNFFSNLHMVTEAVKHFKEDTGCTILFSTSVNAAKGHPDLLTYTATKAAQVSGSNRSALPS